jgi:hypothetical protein
MSVQRRRPETISEPLQVLFHGTLEIFATDGGGSFHFPLLYDEGKTQVATAPYDEVRFVVSIWHPSPRRSIDLDRAYVELRARFDPEEEHWMKLAEIEPVVPAYGGGESFDGWVVLPVMAPVSAFALFGSGFEPRARLQVRALAYFVA